MTRHRNLMKWAETQRKRVRKVTGSVEARAAARGQHCAFGRLIDWLNKHPEPDALAHLEGWVIEEQAVNPELHWFAVFRVPDVDWELAPVTAIFLRRKSDA